MFAPISVNFKHFSYNENVWQMETTNLIFIISLPIDLASKWTTDKIDGL
jgi:hypothetical protein